MGQRPFGMTTGLFGAELHEDGRRRLIPLAQPVPEARPQPEIAARSAGVGAAHPCIGCAPAFCRRGLAHLFTGMGTAPIRRSTPRHSTYVWRARTKKEGQARRYFSNSPTNQIQGLSAARVIRNTALRWDSAPEPSEALVEQLAASDDAVKGAVLPG